MPVKKLKEKNWEFRFKIGKWFSKWLCGWLWQQKKG